MRDEPAGLKCRDGTMVPLEGVSARGVSRGLAFELVVEQRYRNTRDTNIEAVYAFPLPVEAVLLDLEIELGGRKLVANVVEKRAAERDYEEAIVQGNTAIMLEFAGDGLCTLNLGNLMAGESAVIRYRYGQLLRFQHGSVRLTIPTVIAPRYGDPGEAGTQPHQVPTTDLLASYPFTLSLDLDRELAHGEIASPTHAIATTLTADGVHVELAAGAFLDRDFVLTVGKLAGRAISTVTRDGDGYVALASFCAQSPSELAPLPVTLKLLVDCSGSMGGDSIEAAKRAMHRILENLEPEDRVSLTCFGSSFRHLTEGFVSGEANHIRSLAETVGRLGGDMGGTEMESALRGVFAIGGNDGAADVLLLTDGEVWRAESLIDAARAARQRVFAVGIGAAPAEGVLRGLADATGGACEFVASKEDAEAAILRMFARIRAPRFASAEVRWPVKPTWEVPLPTGLFAGETIHAMARFSALPSGEARISLNAEADTPPLVSTTSLSEAVDDGRTVARVAASRHLATLGADDQLAIALDYRLLTDRTNLIVVHERAAGEQAVDLPELAQIAQMHAAGWHGVGSVREVNCVRLESLVLNCIESPKRLAESRSVFPDMRDLDPTFSAADVEANWSTGERPMDAFAGLGRGVAESGPPRKDWIPAFALRWAEASPRWRFDGRSRIADLAAAGVPEPVLEELRAMVTGSDSEADVVRAFLEAIVWWHDRRPDGLRLPRHAMRRMRRPYPNVLDHIGLRMTLKNRVFAWVSGVGADVPVEVMGEQEA